MPGRRARQPLGQVRLSKAVLANVGAVQTLPDFLATAGQTTLEQRKVIVEQALVMIDQTYVALAR